MTMRLELPYEERVRTRASKIDVDWKAVLFYMLIAVPFVLGWLAGLVVVAVKFFLAAVAEGYSSIVVKKGSG